MSLDMERGGVIIMSDVHANVTALRAVLDDISARYADVGVVLVGDLINYGMRPNEVVGMIAGMSQPIPASVCGNHEKALFDGDLSRFSTDRGRRMLEYTAGLLTEESRAFLRDNCAASGMCEIELTAADANGKMRVQRVLVVHGSLSDPYWGRMDAAEMERVEYAQYDLVISGHTHVPQLVEKFYDNGLPEYRGKKRTVFLNPGSVGQPRNHNPHAQYAWYDILTGRVHFNKVAYDVEAERRLLAAGLDPFYADRLILGV